MAAVTRRAAAPIAEVAGINFGDLDMYSGSILIPPGPYALEFTIQMFQGQDKQGQSKYGARLGAMVTAHSLTDPDRQGENAYKQFYSMGTDAHKSFQPNSETGKGLVAVPGGAASTLPGSTNWGIFLKSLYDSGLPKGVFMGDISVLDGVHVVMAHIPEPEERKGFTSSTSEMAGEQRGNKMVAVVSEIYDDGKPWEGKGGIPSGTTAAAPAKTAPKVTPIVKNSLPAAAEPVADDADVFTAAINAATEVFSSINPATKKSNAEGMTHLAFRTSTFTQVKKTHGDDMAQAVADTYFANLDAANSLLNQLGYGSNGTMVKPI